jgi:hypothetical protein
MMLVHQIALAAVVVGIGVCSMTAPVGGQAADPLIGTWTMDPAQSNFSPGPGPKSLTLTFEDTVDGVKYGSELVTPDGQTVHQAFTAKADGKDYPVANAAIDTVALTRNGKARTRVDTKGGQVVMTYDAMLSADGKTFTVHQKGVDAQGRAVDNNTVFVKKM